MLPPVRREVLREREAQDDADDAAVSARETPGERLALTIELSELTRALAEAVGAPWVTAPADDLGEKARLYAAPLRLLVRP
ncbi:MAG: hypothetical protein HY744_12105 [Deltaproteobacteria bacterium]|nr:hypothetical protein [Deltaproteobacteria bacterium]